MKNFLLIYLFSLSVISSSCEENVKNNESEIPTEQIPDQTQLTSDTTNFYPVSKIGETVKHTYFTLSYIEQYEQAQWVYYKLTDQMLTGTQDRTDDFRPDPLIKTESAQLSDYSGSGYDRGHLCPAADMVMNKTAMSETFFLSNMSPMNASFNRGIWSTLESKVRDYAIINKQLHIATGAIFKSNKGSIGSNLVTVPGYYYKVLYAPTNNKMIGFILPNENSSKELGDFAVTVDSVESMTDIDFFSQLPNDNETPLEANRDLSKWSLTVTTPTTPSTPNTPVSSNCPTTSNCGCSNKTKSVCETSPCCQWIVGTGCKCK